MTIAISLKVNDGLVLASDSAATLVDKGGGVANVHNNANKVFNLRKGLPIGAVTYGAGEIGGASISTLIKDLRMRFSGEDQIHKDWHIDNAAYKISDVAKNVKRFIYDEMYEPSFKDWETKPLLGFIVAGYSSGELMSEVYTISITNGVCEGPTLIRSKNESGINWNGEPEAIFRLLKGFGMGLPKVLKENLGVNDDQIDPAMDIIGRSLEVPLWSPAMPIQDAIDLAEFLVDLTIKFSRFKPGAPTVGGPIEVAAITKHEHFKWVYRKHYFDREFNTEVGTWKR